jgi:hypothetical protein
MFKHKLIIAFILTASIFALQNEGTALKPSSKVWILFKERIGNQKLDTSRFTRAAISRRTHRAEIAFDQSDLPVQREFLEAVQSAGATILVESRWLHGVSARCSSECLERIRKFGFVREIRPVITYRRAQEPILEDRSGPYGTAGPQYGKSKEQLVQISVPPVHKKGYSGEGEIVAVFDSGFRKDHIAFRNQTVIAERDFVFGDDDVSNGVNTDSHGTGTWSLVGGEAPGKLYGAAYRAQFLLAATEDIRSETVVEEDNWVAAFEWADQHGASVVSSSLGYSDWYTQGDYDGTTAITSRVVSKAANKGILVVNSAGNAGPGVSTLSAPADAKKMLAVGAVNFAGTIADFSSRGPTADGRIKPEVVARGVSAYVASSNSQTSFGHSNGTSFSCPLVAGAAALLLSAHPGLTPVQVREALIETASQAATPDNTYGSGIVNLLDAYNYLPKKSVVIDEHKPLKNTSNKTTPYKVTARIRAERNINTSQSFLFWKKEGTGTFQKILFKPIAGKPDYFEALIPAQAQGSTILYYLAARDVRGKGTTLPLEVPSNTFAFNIL